MNETDWLLNNLNGTLPVNFADIKQSGFDFKLGKNDSYWNLQQVKDHPAFKDETGKANKKKFDDFYNANLQGFNQYKKEDFNQFQFDEARVLDTAQNRRLGFDKFITNPIDLKIDKFVTNPFKQTIGFTGINEKSDPKYSHRELAQMSPFYLDTDTGKKVKFDDPYGGIGDALFGPTLVMAKDENGNYKIDPETGTFYAETLAGRDPSGKEVFTFDNILTEEGSFANKYTPLGALDSDNLNKSVGGVIMKEAIKWAPFFIPGVGQAYGAALLGKSMLDIGLEFYKTADQAITGKGKDDSRYKGVNTVMGWLNRYTASSVSENAKENPFGAENLISMISNIGLDIKNQGLVANTGALLAGKTGARAGSLIYNVGTANKAVMDIADTNNLTSEDRGLLSLATIGAFGFLYSNLKVNPLSAFTNYVEAGAMKNVEGQLIKKSIMEYSDEFIKELGKVKGLPPEQKAKAFLDISKNLANNYKNKLNSFVSELKESGATTIPAGAIAESVEETSETVLQEGILQAYNNIADYGKTYTKNKNNTPYKFKDLWGENFKDELLMSAFGGAIAGGGMHALSAMKNKPVSEDLINLIQQGKTDEALRAVDELEAKGMFAPKDLSMETIKDKDNIYWKPTDKVNISQNKFIADTVRREIIKNDNFIRTIGADKTNLDSTSEVINETFNNLINGDFHTSLRSDNIGLTKKILAQAAVVGELEEQLNKVSDNILKTKIESDLKLAKEEYTKLQGELKNNSLTDNKFNNLDEYVKQSLFSTYPSVGNKFGIKNKKDFTDKEGKFDEEGYKDYIRIQRTNDIRRAISEYDEFSNEDNIKKIKSISPEDFQDYFSNKLLNDNINEFLKSDNNDFEISPDTVVDNSLIEKFSNPEFTKSKNDFIEFAKIYSTLLNKYEEDSNFLKSNNKEGILKELEQAIENQDLIKILSIEKEVNDLKKKYIQERNERIWKDLDFEEEFDESDADFQMELMNERSNPNEKFVGKKLNILDNDFINSLDSSKKIAEELSSKNINSLFNNKTNKLFHNLSKSSKKTDINKKVDSLFKNIQFELTQQKELSKNSTTYSTDEIENNLNMLKAAIDKYSGYVSSMITVNPSMNNFRKSDKAKQYIDDEKKLNLVDYEIEKNTHDLLHDKLKRYEEEADYFIKLVKDNRSNKLKYIIQDQVIQAKRINDTLQNLSPDLEFKTSRTTELFEDGNLGKLVDYKVDYSKLQDIYKELEFNFDLFKKNYNENESFQRSILSKIKDAKGISFTRDEKEMNPEEKLNLVNTVIRGNYTDFLSRLRNVIDSNNNYAPFYFQESSLFQIFSKFQNDKKNILFETPEFQAKVEEDKTFIADNIILIDSTAGSGKTSVILRQATQLDPTKKFALFAPKQSQVELIKKSIEGLPPEFLDVQGTFNQLNDIIFGDNKLDTTKELKYVRNSNGTLVPDVDYRKEENAVYAIVNFADGTTQRLDFDKDRLSSLSNKDGIVIDEGTHLNPITYFFLKELNIPIIVMLDTSQLGHNHKGIITGVGGFEGKRYSGEWTINTAIVERVAKQIYSVRNQYQGVPEASKALFNLLNSPEIQINSTNQEFAQIKDKDTYKIPVQSYTKDDFVGFYVGNNNEDEILSKIPASTDKNEIVFIVKDEIEKEAAEKKYKDRGVVLTYDNVQGQEFDYVFILSTPFSVKDESIFSTQDYLKTLYTMVSRSKKGTYYNKEEGYEVTFKQLDPMESAVKSVPLTAENIKDYKEFKLNALKDYTTVIPSTPKTVIVDDDDIIKAVKNQETDVIIKDKNGQFIKLGNDDAESKSSEKDAPFYVRLFTWYNNKQFYKGDKYKKFFKTKDNSELSEQLIVIKHALVYGSTINAKTNYIKSFIEKFESSGKDISILENTIDLLNTKGNEISYNIESINWDKNGAFGKGVVSNFNPVDKNNSSENLKQMLITATIGDTKFDLVALPFIDDYREFVEASGTKSSGFAIKFKNEDAYNRLVELQKQLEKGPINIDKKIAETLLSSAQRGRGKIKPGKAEDAISIEQYVKENPSILMSKPFLITESEGNLRGRLAVFYSYDPETKLDNINDEKQLSNLYKSWKSKSSGNIGMFFINEEYTSLDVILNNFRDIRSHVANSKDSNGEWDPDANKYFATQLNSLFSNLGLKQFFNVVYDLHNYPIKLTDKKSKLAAEFTSSLKKFITEDGHYKKTIFPGADVNPFTLDKAKFNEFLSNYKTEFTGINTLYKESRIYSLLDLLNSTLEKINSDNPKKTKEDTVFTLNNLFKGDFNLQTGFVKEYLTKTKIDAKKDNQVAGNSVAIIEGNFNTKYRISPIEISVDSKFFEELLDGKKEVTKSYETKGEQPLFDLTGFSVENDVSKQKNIYDILKKFNLNPELLNGKVLSKNGQWMFNIDGRNAILMKVGKGVIPFYFSSSGTSGKRMDWHPFFGYDNNVGWLIKGKVDERGELVFGKRWDLYRNNIIEMENTLTQLRKDLPLNDSSKEALKQEFTNNVTKGIKSQIKVNELFKNFDVVERITPEGVVTNKNYDIVVSRFLYSINPEIVSKNSESKSTSTEDSLYEDENLTEDIFNTEFIEEGSEEFSEFYDTADEEIVNEEELKNDFNPDQDIVPKESQSIKVANLDELLEVQDLTTDLDVKLENLLSIQKIRFGNSATLSEFASERMYYDIILPSSYIDLEKGNFVKEEEINDNILNAKLKLIKGIIESSNVIKNKATENQALLVFDYNGKATNIIDFVKDESISLRERIDEIVGKDHLRKLLNSEKPKELYSQYNRLKRENDDTHSSNRGSENLIIKQYIDYVLLKDFDVFVKYDENINSRLINSAGIYKRKRQAGFDKSYKESSETDIREAGSELFTTTIETIPLVEYIKGEYKETGKLQYAKVMNLLIDVKSNSKWKRENIHDELKSIIMDNMMNDEQISLSDRNIYRSLYYFLYSPSDVSFVDKFNQKKKYKSIDNVLKNTDNKIARLFHTAIENIFNTTNRNYQMGIVKDQNERFQIVDTIIESSEKHKGILISNIDDFVNDENDEFTKTSIDGENAIMYKNSNTNEHRLPFDIFSQFKFFDNLDKLTIFGINWMKLKEPYYFNANKTEQGNITKNLKKEIIELGNMIHIAKLRNQFPDVTDFIKEVSDSGLLKNRRVNKFFEQFKKEKYNIEKLYDLAELLNIVKSFANVINTTLATEEKSIQLGLDGKAHAKFTPMNNTLEIFNKVLRDKDENNDSLFKNDLISLLNNC